MRIFKRDQFLALPEGVIFAAGGQWFFDGLFVKGETITLDGEARGYWARELTNIDSDGMSGDDRDLFRRLEEMLGQGASHPLCDCETKFIPVEEEELFLVFEDADLDALSAIALAAKGKL